MNLKLSRRSILFIEPLAKISSIFGIIPFYDFQTHDFKNVKLFRFYSLFLACLLPVLSANLLCLRFHYLYDGSSRNFVILDILLEALCSIAYEITTLGFSTWNMTAWQQLFQSLHQLEDKQNLNVKSKESHSALTNPNFLFLVGTATIPIIYAGELYYHREEKYYCLMYISIYFYFYVEFVYANIISNIALSIRYKYEGIYNLLSNILICTGKPERTIEAIRKIKMLFLATDNVLTIFNTLFGLPILFMLGVTIMLILNCMIIFAGTSLKLSGLECPITPEIVSIYASYAVISCLYPTVIIFCCDEAIKESKKLLVTCYKLEAVLPMFSKEKEELKSLENIINSKPPKFTAAGFFEIDRSILLSIFGTIATYFVVCVQFSNL